MKRSFILLCVLGAAYGQSSEGDQCTTSTGHNGKCTRVSKCVSVESSIHKQITDHVVCGYDGPIQIVCCASVQSPVNMTTNRLLPNSISDRKCNEYNELSYNTIRITNTFGPPVERKKLNCTFTWSPLIVGGVEAKVHEFPHMALIGYEVGDTIHWGCGGTLISERFILSAAHCSDTSNGPAKYARLGEHDQNRVDESTALELQIIKRISHPDYHYPMKYNDIALFELKRSVQLSGTIRPACLPQVSAIPTKTAIASGWGKVAHIGNQSNVLLKVVLEMFSLSECNATYGKNIDRKLDRGILDESQVCAGSHSEEKDTCQGDSGGPLQIYHVIHPCSYTVVGITSFGKPCGVIGSAGVYTRVHPYLSWIEGIVWQNQ